MRGRDFPLPAVYLTMIPIAITAEAYAAIAGTLPGNVGVERARAENGDV